MIFQINTKWILLFFSCSQGKRAYIHQAISGPQDPQKLHATSWTVLWTCILLVENEVWYQKNMKTANFRDATHSGVFFQRMIACSYALQQHLKGRQRSFRRQRWSRTNWGRRQHQQEGVRRGKIERGQGSRSKGSQIQSIKRVAIYLYIATMIKPRM